MKNLGFIFLVSILAMSNIAVAEGKKIVKWVDSKGVTQYGDKLPASEAGRNNSEMNTQGMTLKKNTATDKSNEVLDLQKLEQERKDKILLASYTNVEEIDLARERNLQMDKANIQALTQQKVNVTSRSARNNKTAEGFKARKKPVPAYLSDELKLSKIEIANIDKQLAQRKLSMEATRTRYSEEKARFTALKQPTLAGTAASPAGSIDAASSPADKTAVKDIAVKEVASANVAKPNSAPAPVDNKKTISKKPVSK
jgi:hypothetical protein